MNDSYGPKTSCLGGTTTPAYDFGVPDANENNRVAAVPHELQPLRGDFGVEHIVTADDRHDLLQGRFIDAG